MNTRSLHWYLLGLAVLGLLGACGGGGGGGGGNTPAAAGTVQIEGASYDATEGTVVNMRVARSGGSSGVASVTYTLSDGTATGGSDYAAPDGTLTWPHGRSGNQTISIAIADDDAVEPLESFTVTLRAVGGTVLGANSSATVNIVDNDTADLSAFGTITELGSVTVNGIRYNTNAASVFVNDVPANVSDLKLGQVVALEGEANFSDATGRADEIRYLATAIGPVESIDAPRDRLIVMGQTVLTNADTVFDERIVPSSLAGLAVGQIVQISGFRNADGDVVATRIEPDTEGTDVQLIGVVAGLDVANMLFTLNRMTVDYSNAVLIDLPAGMPTDGLNVMVRGSLVDGMLVVSEITGIADPSVEPGERAHFGGLVTYFSSSVDFRLNGLRVRIHAGTRFANGFAADLRANIEITIDGSVSFGSNIVVADRITFGRPLPVRTTRAYDFDDFTNISVFGLTRVMVVQGPDFSVDVTSVVDGDDNVPVTQSDDTLTFGDTGTRMLSARVTMPVLNRIDVGTAALAHVTLRDFDQPRMTVNVGGVSYLQGQGLTIGDLTANVSGVSFLDFAGIRPIGSAGVQISGVSQARLNMDAASTLTGSVRTGQGTGVSTLFYYGTDVALDVTTDSVSRVIRLGGTRP